VSGGDGPSGGHQREIKAAMQGVSMRAEVTGNTKHSYRETATQSTPAARTPHDLQVRGYPRWRQESKNNPSLVITNLQQSPQ
jgi:hypothetical protein